MEEYTGSDQGGEGRVVTSNDLEALLLWVFGKVQEELSGLHTDIGNLGGNIDTLSQALHAERKVMLHLSPQRSPVYATIPITSPFAQ